MTMIESLPAETVIQILKEVSQLEFQQDPFSLPITLLQCMKVSRRWHSIALQTPDLYTNIVIPFNTLRQRNYSILRWAQFWFKQSRTYAITVAVRFNTNWKSIAEDLSIIHQILRDYIIPHSFRLRAFHFICPPNAITLLTEIFRPLLTSVVDAPCLEELDVRMVALGVYYSIEPRDLQPLFRSTPNLHKLGLHGSFMFAPLTGLLELDLRKVVIWEDSFHKFVLNCPKLEYLALRSAYYSSSPYDTSSAPILMNSLRSLILELDSSIDFDLHMHKMVVTRILAPNLEDLEVSTSRRIVDVGNVLPVASSLTKLRRLKLVGVTRGLGEPIPTTDLEVIHESKWFKDLPSDSVEEIHLTNTSGAILGIDSPAPTVVHRKRPAEDDLQILQNDMVPLFDSLTLSSSSSSSSFTNLKSLAIYSFVEEDMVWLCRLLSVRPTIQTVYLSNSALTALRTSILLLPDEGSGRWFIGVCRPGSLTGGWDCDSATRGIDVEEWVKQRVQLKVLVPRLWDE